MPETKMTQLDVPVELKERIDAEAATDRRTYKAELIELIEEALNARDRKRRA